MLPGTVFNCTASLRQTLNQDFSKVFLLSFRVLLKLSLQSVLNISQISDFSQIHNDLRICFLFIRSQNSTLDIHSNSVSSAPCDLTKKVPRTQQNNRPVKHPIVQDTLVLEDRLCEVPNARHLRNCLSSQTSHPNFQSSFYFLTNRIYVSCDQQLEFPTNLYSIEKMLNIQY